MIKEDIRALKEYVREAKWRLELVIRTLEHVVKKSEEGVKLLKGLSPFLAYIKRYLIAGERVQDQIALELREIKGEDFWSQVDASLDYLQVKPEEEEIKRKDFQGMTIKEMLWDLKKQLSSLDEREIILQRNVAVLSEQINTLLILRKEWRELWKLILPILAIIFTIILTLLEMFYK